MYLLDTDTLVFFLKGQKQVVENMLLHQRDPKALSVISYGELLYGANKSANPLKNSAKVRQLGDICPVMELTLPVVETFAALKSSLEDTGKRLDDFDLLIASTAMSLNYILVTNNTKHFSRINGLTIENWSAKDN